MAAMLDIAPSTGRPAILYAFLASALFVHFRGQVRIRFYRQITDHSTFMAPYNALMYLFSAVPNRPFIDAAQFPELKPVTDNWQMLRDEALQLFDEGYIRGTAKYNDLGFNSFFRRGWKRFYVKWYDEPLPSAQALARRRSPWSSRSRDQRRDVRAAAARRQAGQAPRSLRGVAALPPRARRRRTPRTAASSSTAQPYHWRDGEAVMFDETFIHWAENKSDKLRVILFCDVERPLKSRVMTASTSGTRTRSSAPARRRTSPATMSAG